MKKYTVKDGLFFDTSGKKVNLKGVNMVCKDKDLSYLGNYSEEDFRVLENCGYNIVRFGIFWDAVEPQPGKYNDDYLKKVKELSEIAGRHGICMFLDMHQDLFSAEFCDGAPGWATLSNGEEYIPTELWSEAYLVSPAVQNAFDSFWNNAPAADGVGIRTRFINMWRHIAEFFSDDENVIGYDCFNEPFPGTEANNLMGMLLMKLAGYLSEKGKEVSPEEVMGMWMDNEAKASLLSEFNDCESYRGLVAPLAAALKDFDENVLSGFYQELRDSIRKADKESLIFVETNYFCNTGIPSGVIPPKDENGIQDTLLVYAPHGYDLMVDTDLYGTSLNSAAGTAVDTAEESSAGTAADAICTAADTICTAADAVCTAADAVCTSADTICTAADLYPRLTVIFETHAEYAAKHNLPCLVGEWGCYAERTDSQLCEAKFLVSLFEKLGFSNTYYDYSCIFCANDV